MIVLFDPTLKGGVKLPPLREGQDEALQLGPIALDQFTGQEDQPAGRPVPNTRYRS